MDQTEVQDEIAVPKKKNHLISQKKNRYRCRMLQDLLAGHTHLRLS